MTPVTLPLFRRHASRPHCAAVCDAMTLVTPVSPAYVHTHARGRVRVGSVTRHKGVNRQVIQGLQA